MSSTDLATVVIACPHCGTRYQVPHATLGAGGREVQCAQCGKSWHAEAHVQPPPAIDPDIMFPGDELALDTAFEDEARTIRPAVLPPKAAPPAPAQPSEQDRTLAEIRAAIAPKPKKQPVNAIDAAALTKAQKSSARRQRALVGKLPLARFRRTARAIGVIVLATILVLGITQRTPIVRWFPALAGLYATVGLPVNIVGLEFQDSKTINSLRGGKMVMQITARIRSISSKSVAVPPVLVSLLNDKGVVVYEWTVTPSAPEMGPGDVLDFSTEVNAPPQGAASVRLTFTTKAS